MSAHTQTPDFTLPLKVGHPDASMIFDARNCFIGRAGTEGWPIGKDIPRAAFIVRAVNSHEAMREALTECADVMERAQKLLRVAGLTMEGGTISGPYNEAITKARASLALAEPKA